ncbi:MAG: DsbA family protein [Candidatus Parcubacteria bacterium]|nr:DsbA family protein [Candidatus Parcubacteria bacterium]
MLVAEKIKAKQKKWHQRWWGILILIIVGIFITYVGAFIYQVVSLVETQNQLLAQSYNASSLDDSSLRNSINIRSMVEIPEAPYFGPVQANVVIVEFSDFQCPYSKEAYPILKRIRSEYKDAVKIIYRDFPNFNIHPDALNSALAANCAFEQNKFEPYHDLLFENQDNLSLDNLKNLATEIGLEMTQFNQCLDSNKYLAKIQNDLQDGLKFGINGTPTFFINGSLVAGVIPYDSLKSAINILLSTGVQENVNLNSGSLTAPKCSTCNK